MMKKHKKHKTDKKERYEGRDFSNSDKQPALKLILKVGGSNSTPEHSNDSPCHLPAPSVASSLYSVSGTLDDESRQSTASSLFPTPEHSGVHYEKHKKAKKKKKKKDRSKDREKKHKHHHKEKRRRRDESSQDDISIGEDSLNESPLIKCIGDISTPVGGLLQSRISTNSLLRTAMANTFNASEHQPQYIAPASGENSQNTIQDGGGGGVGGSTGGAGGSGSGNSLSMAGRSPRSCVLRQRELEKKPFCKLLDYLVKTLEKRDVQQFFAWPVTDLIAPGYSHIITNPMDFSTMKQKINDNQYANFQEFVDDFKLMCNNAMEYNHVDTIYYKAAKKLQHVGTKFLQPEKIRSLRHLLPFIQEIPKDELGFEINIIDEVKNEQNIDIEESIVSNVIPTTNSINSGDLSSIIIDSKRKIKELNFPLTKFEAIADDLTPEEILAQVQRAAKIAKQKLSTKAVEPKMGFLRQKKDGTTTLNILIGGEGLIEGTNEKPISLGALTGKLTCGTGQLQGFKEDRRNIVKSNKPLYYGAFGSYAPSFDSTFANLSKEESDLVLQTYGDENAVQYAESILDFTKDCDYTLHMVDSLLDILTGGEHTKTKKILEERKRLREEEETIRKLLEEKSSPNQEKNPEEKIDITTLKTLSTLGIDVSFLDNFEQQVKLDEEQKILQERLETTSQLLEKLQQVQNDRLSMQPPSHLSNIQPPTENEISLADKITENLTDMAKKITPSHLVSLSAVRKAMGIAPPPPAADTSSIMDVDGGGSNSSAVTTAVAGSTDVPPAGDLESELREFLENAGPTLSPHSSHLHDADNTIEDMLMD